jgi:hypothetical protein
MPATSKAQHRLMGAIAGGNATKKTGLSKGQAKEFIRGQSRKGLPERSRNKMAHRGKSSDPTKKPRKGARTGLNGGKGGHKTQGGKGGHKTEGGYGGGKMRFDPSKGRKGAQG